MFEKGVSYYTKGSALIFVHFPENAIACQFCKFLWQDSIGRYWCRLTDEMVYNPKTRSDMCPIVLDDDPYDINTHREGEE